MNYINFELLHKRGFNIIDYGLIIASYQNSKKDTSADIAMMIQDDEQLDRLMDEGYLKFIQGTKKQNSLQKLRADKNGKKLIEDVSTVNTTEDDIRVFEWLEELYNSMGKIIGNKRKTKNYIAEFRELSGIDKNKLIFLCRAFVQDDNEQVYSFKLENVLYKPRTAFNIKFDLEESRLYSYYLKRKEFFDNKFKEL